MDETIEFKDLGLDKLVKAFKGQLPMAKVGILGSKDSRTNNGSNATIGAKHEFGLDGMPQRSFLRVPITEHMQEYLDKSGAIDPAMIKQVIQDGSIEIWVSKLGILAESIVLDAFATGGFGQWKPSNMNYKTNHQTLVETKQLRDSISSEVA